MKEDGIIKSAQGIVPFEEVNTLGGEFELDEPAEVPPEAPIVIAEDATEISSAAARKIKENVQKEVKA